jgi:hypothetical protein
MRITDQSDRPVSVPNLNGPVIPWLLGGPIHGLLVGWTLDLPASADVLIRIDKEKAVSRLLRCLIARAGEFATRGRFNSPPLATGTETLGEAEPLLTNNFI